MLVGVDFRVSWFWVVFVSSLMDICLLLVYLVEFMLVCLLFWFSMIRWVLDVIGSGREFSMLCWIVICVLVKEMIWMIFLVFEGL